MKSVSIPARESEAGSDWTAELWSLALLVLSLPRHTLSPGQLLKAALALWVTNVLVFAGDMWQRTFNDVAREYPQVQTDYCHVDAASMFFLTQPERFDVLVTDNLFGDILTDIGAAIAGGIVLGVALWLFAWRGAPGGAPTDATPLARRVIPEGTRVKVEVLNGTDTRGLATFATLPEADWTAITLAVETVTVPI